MTKKRFAHQLRHTHASGKFSRSAKSLFSSLQFYIGISSIITLTEVVGRDRLHAVHRVAKWASYKNRHADAAIVWRAKRFTSLKELGLHLGTTTDGARRDIWASAVVLHDKKSGRKILVSVVHLISDVEFRLFGNLHAQKHDQRGADYQDHFNEWVSQVEQLAKDEGVDQIVMSCDSNLNYHKVWVQEFARQELESDHLEVTWKDHLPDDRTGTHGSRLIDWAISSMHPSVVKVLAKHLRWSDHTAFHEVLKFD